MEKIPSFPLYQIMPGNQLLDHIKTNMLPVYRYLVDEFIPRSPEEVTEWQFLIKMKRGIRIDLRETFENLITNVLMSVLSTGTFSWTEEKSGKQFFIKTNMPSGMVYYLGYLKDQNLFGRTEEKHLRDYLKNPESFQYLSDKANAFNNKLREENDYLLRLSITSINSIHKKFSSFLVQDQTPEIHFPEHYLSFFNRIIGEFMISDPSIIYRTDFHNFLDSFSFVLNLDETELWDDEFAGTGYMDHISKKFIRNTLIVDFLHNTGFSDVISTEKLTRKKFSGFLQQNTRIVEEVSNTILGYIYKTILHVLVNEGRLFLYNGGLEVGELLEKSMDISRYVVLNWNGNEKKYFLPWNGSKWNEEEPFPEIKLNCKISDLKKMKREILEKYRDEMLYIIKLTEEIWTTR